VLLYIHGFRSTVRSPKAQQLKNHFGDAIWLADHPWEPDAAIAYLDETIRTHSITGLLASSLGGFYATYLAEHFGLPTVLINPSVRPYITTRAYLGTNTTDDGIDFEWEERHLAALKTYAVHSPSVAQYYLFLQAGDTVLDYRVARAHYRGSKLCLEEGGNHGFDGLERHFRAMEDFLIPNRP